MKKLLLCAGLLAVSLSCFAQHMPVLFQHVRVFDGSQTIADTNVLIEGGRIKAVGPDVSDDSARVIDGHGKTLLPGLIDAHAHIHGDRALQQALVFGVATEMDMMMPPRLEARLKAANSSDMASFFSAGSPATVPGGHGTEYGMEIPTLTRAKDADGFVGDRVREGSDYIKIMYTWDPERPRQRPTLSRDTMAAVVAAAHKRHLLAVVHINSAQGARDAIEAGVDGLAHLFTGDSSPNDFGQFAAAHHIFVVPTLGVLHSICGPESAGSRLITDPDLSPYLDRESIDRLKETFPFAQAPRAPSCRGASQAIKQLKAAGVPILAGTDCPNPGTTQGASMHGELELLVEAGLTPSEALTAATAAPAAMFHMPDRGRIAPGLRADLLLVDGDPTQDIKVTRRIVAVYKEGAEVNRERFRQR